MAGRALVPLLDVLHPTLRGMLALYMACMPRTACGTLVQLVREGVNESGPSAASLPAIRPEGYGIVCTRMGRVLKRH
jgi:hypothetical protein